MEHVKTPRETGATPKREAISSAALFKKGFLIARELDGMIDGIYKKYGSSETKLGVTHRVYSLFGALGEERIAGKRILDLACGSRFNKETISNRSMEPWTARLLHELGGNVTGIDIAPQVGESFRSHACDLTKKGALDFLGSSEYDVVACNLFVNFIGKGALPILVWSPSIRDWSFDKKEEIKIELLAQITRVMKEGGILFTDYDFRKYAVYVKENGNLRMISPEGAEQ